MTPATIQTAPQSPPLRVTVGNWQLDIVNGGEFWLDGGVMFGVVPKSIWQSVVTPDEASRIRCGNHCLLARDGSHTVLIDTGYGGKHSSLDRKFYKMEDGEPLLRSLAALGVEPDEIDTVVFSHLHFDHVGGATRFDQQKRRIPTFPRAQHIVSRWEWEDATGDKPELATAYPLDDILPLFDAGRMMVVDDGQELLPGLRCQVTGGHTRGHMSLFFQSGGQTGAYLGDICPSTAHLRRMWHLAYDTHPLDTRRRKPELLARAAAEGWWIAWNHDPRTPLSRIRDDAKKEFVAIDCKST